MQLISIPTFVVDIDLDRLVFLCALILAVVQCVLELFLKLLLDFLRLFSSAVYLSLLSLHSPGVKPEEEKDEDRYEEDQNTDDSRYLVYVQSKLNQ
jgi:hypothetical protein